MEKALSQYVSHLSEGIFLSDQHQPRPDTLPRLVEIPEILAEIFGYLRKGDLAPFVAVNRCWAEVALDPIWEHLPGLIYLARILQPLRWRMIHNYWDLDPNASPDWVRFEYYARRVRILSHTQWGIKFSATLSNMLSPDVMTLLSSGHRGRALPAVKEIQWGSKHDTMGIHYLSYFMGPSLKRLTINADSSSNREALLSFAVRVSRMRNVQLDEFAGFGDYLSVAYIGDDPTLEILQSQLHLKKYEGTCWTLSQNLVGALSNLKELRTLKLKIETVTEDLVNEAMTIFVASLHHIDTVSFAWDASPPRRLFDPTPLLRWSLIDVEIENPCELYLGLLRRMGESWPTLRRFKINSKPKGISMGLPLSNLGVISAVFPCLEELDTVFHLYKEDDPLPTPAIATFRNLDRLNPENWFISRQRLKEASQYVGGLLPQDDTPPLFEDPDQTLAGRDGSEGSNPMTYAAKRNFWEKCAMDPEGQHLVAIRDFM